MTDDAYLGCYTAASGGRGDGITLAVADPATGALNVRGTVAVTDSPSYLAAHPDGRTLYAAGELPAGVLSAYRRAPDGTLTPLDAVPSGGAAPCHVAVHPSGAYLAVTHYGDGVVTLHELGPDGVPAGPRRDLAPPARGRDGARAHHVRFERGSRLVVADLGADAVHTWAGSPSGITLIGSGRLPDGSGPRQTAPLAGGRMLVVGELDAHLHLTAYDAATGRVDVLASAPTSAAGPDVDAPSELLVAPDGRHAYVANRGSDTLAVFALAGDPVDEVTRITEVPAGGRWPRQVTWWRTGPGDRLYVAAQHDDAIARLGVDPVTAVPAPAGPPAPTGSPTCVLILPRLP